MKVSVVTPNYNGLKFLNNYFETLLIQSRFIEEIILIVKRNENNQNEFSLGIRIDEKTSILLLSLHALYNKFLYTDLKAVLPIDYNSVAMAELSEEKKIYSIYKRDVE